MAHSWNCVFSECSLVITKTTVKMDSEWWTISISVCLSARPLFPVCYCPILCEVPVLNVILFLPGNVRLHVQVGTCWNCQSVVPLNLPKCLTCDVLLTTDRSVMQPKQREDAAYLVCVICGTPNSRNDRARSCITCNAGLSNAKVTVFIFLLCV